MRLVRGDVPIVLIGPVCAGKSTVLPLIAERLGRRAVDLDTICWRYYEEVGRGRGALTDKIGEVGFTNAMRWWEVGHPHVLRRLLADSSDPGVFALGAGHTHTEDSELFAEIETALRGTYAVLLLPSADRSESIAILRQRCLRSRNRSWNHDGYDFIESWVNDDCNYRLADAVIFTEGNGPAETAEDVLTSIRAEE